MRKSINYGVSDVRMATVLERDAEWISRMETVLLKFLASKAYLSLKE
jgi:hypothetical protein